MAQLREYIDKDDVEASIDKVCEEYMKLVRAARGEGLTELDDQLDGEDDDEELEEDDEDEDDAVNLGDEDEEDDDVAAVE